MKIKRINVTHQGVALIIEYDKKVYEPGLLTRTLSDLMEVMPGDRVIDVGCGTGYLGIMASLLGASEVIAIDPLPEAVIWTQHNSRVNGINNLTVILGDALDPVEDGRADLILSLPPQMPYPTNFNRCRYGGSDGTDVILKIIKQSSFILKNKWARLFLVHSALAHPAKIRNAFLQWGFRWEVIKTVEKELDPDDLNNLTPRLTDYLLYLAKLGIVEINKRDGHYYYPVWFYRAFL
ncbi:MAG: methyltransferase [Thermodesulfobacteriota bacterium]|nr:methyltransferase [Thermodesulfobacteriota bacterium]